MYALIPSNDDASAGDDDEDDHDHNHHNGHHDDHHCHPKTATETTLYVCALMPLYCALAGLAYCAYYLVKHVGDDDGYDDVI